jgi:hypothetical protein
MNRYSLSCEFSLQNKKLCNNTFITFVLLCVSQTCSNPMFHSFSRILLLLLAFLGQNIYLFALILFFKLIETTSIVHTNK